MDAFVAMVWLATGIGVWLLVVSPRWRAGWVLLGGSGVVLILSSIVGAQPIPRWVADSGSRMILGWYTLFEVSEANEYLALALLFVHPLLVVALVAVAWRKHRRWATVVLPFAYAPLVVPSVAVGILSTPTSPDASLGAALGGFLLGVIAYVVALVVATLSAAIGPLPPRPVAARAGFRHDDPWSFGFVVAGSTVVVLALTWFVVGVGMHDGEFIPYSGLPGHVHVEGVDARGGVWVVAYPYAGDPPGDYPEIGCLVDGTWEIWSVPKTFAAQRVEALSFGTDGSVWAAPFDLDGGRQRPAGVWRYSEGEWLRYGSADMAAVRVAGMLPIEDGCVLAWGDGIWFLCDGEWRQVVSPPFPHITNIAVSGDGAVWALGYVPRAETEYRVAQYTRGVWTEHRELRASGTVYTSLRVAGSGDVWVTHRYPYEDDAVEYWRHDGTGWTHWETRSEPPAVYEAAIAGAEPVFGRVVSIGGVRWEDGRDGIYRVELAADDEPLVGFVGTPTVPTVTTAPSSTTTTSVPPTTTTRPVPSTTPRPRHSVLAQGSYLPPWPPDGEVFGSGCSPGTPELPDGVWFGWIDEYGATDVTFDLACLFASGDAVRVENSSARLRRPAITADTVVWALQQGGGWRAVPYRRWDGPSLACPDGAPPYRDGCHWWLYVNDGVVTEMLEARFG